MKHVWTLVAVLTSMTWSRVVEASAVLSHDKIRRLCPNFSSDLNRNCTAPYAQDGGWSHWSSWGACQGPCDDGARTRTRTCSNPTPYNCGDTCEGDEFQEHPCTPRHCITTTKTTAVPSTPPTPPTTTTRAVSTTTTAPAKAQSCSKFCAGAAVALNHTLVQTAARTCPDGKHGGSDALLIQCCHLQAASAWRRGANVILGCQSLPSYTPIAKFNSQTYTVDTAGVFVECLTNGEVGFRFIHQTCDKKPEIIHVSTTNAGFDAIKYYTILQ